MVAEGVDVKTAQARLGHSDPRLTLASYAQATTEGDRSAASKLGARLMGSASGGDEQRRLRHPPRSDDAGRPLFHDKGATGSNHVSSTTPPGGSSPLRQSSQRPTSTIAPWYGLGMTYISQSTSETKGVQAPRFSQRTTIPTVDPRRSWLSPLTVRCRCVAAGQGARLDPPICVPPHKPETGPRNVPSGLRSLSR